jgi:hypothetical protein
VNGSDAAEYAGVIIGALAGFFLGWFATADIVIALIGIPVGGLFGAAIGYALWAAGRR